MIDTLVLYCLKIFIGFVTVGLVIAACILWTTTKVKKELEEEDFYDRD